MQIAALIFAFCIQIHAGAQTSWSLSRNCKPKPVRCAGTSSCYRPLWHWYFSPSWPRSRSPAFWSTASSNRSAPAPKSTCRASRAGPTRFNFPSPGNPSTREGWFFPGFRGASTIILCHGYGSSKGELLTLVSALQDHQYNVFVFDFAAHGANDGITSFGYHEADEVRSAIDVVAQRNDVESRELRPVGLQPRRLCRAARGGKRQSRSTRSCSIPFTTCRNKWFASASNARASADFR